MSEVQVANKPTNAEVIDKLFDEAKGQFDAVVICGFDKSGAMKMYCQPDQTIIAHWILSKAQFELNLFEKNSSQQKQQQAQETEKPAKKGSKR
jgi:hypothetical protein